MAKKTSVKFPKKVVDNYIKTVKKDIRVNGVFLFGSFAYGKPTKHSDVDLIVISPNFAKKEFWKRVDWLTRKRYNVADSIAMDVIGYTPREFANIEKHSAIMAKAKKDGKWIYRAKK